MLIYTKLSLVWDQAAQQYVTSAIEAHEYSGPIALCCGASAAQTSIQNQQSQFYTTMQNQATQVFGNDSTVYNELVNTFTPTVAAGPSQQGFSAGELSNLNSQAITQTGQSYQNAKQAVGEAEAAQGGGNVDLPSGASVGSDLSLASSAANQTSSELSQITQADYAQGNQNYNNAVSGLANAGNVFNSATNLDSSATGAGTAAATTANQIAQENNSWTQAVSGALGGIAGATMTGGMANLGKGVGFFGQNAPAPPSSANA